MTLGDATPLAAVDLGSNSFHLLVAESGQGRLAVREHRREPVRLAAGLCPDGGLEPEARNRALDCLADFSRRLGDLPPERVRAVGTNALRRLGAPQAFLDAATAALGHRIDVISGREEGRLVYLGVVQDLPAGARRCLVLDIGGGSTELVIGDGEHPLHVASRPMGCLLWTRQYFASGCITQDNFRNARIAAGLQLQALRRRYRKLGWELALGSSGIVRGIWRVMQAQGWTDGDITREAVERSIALLVEAGTVEDIDFPGLRPDRRPVFPGGLAILAAVFDALELERLRSSSRALRDGLLVELQGRLVARRREPLRAR